MSRGLICPSSDLRVQIRPPRPSFTMARWFSCRGLFVFDQTRIGVTMRLSLVALLFAILLLAGCDGSSTGPDDDFAIFVIHVVDEEFRIRLEDPTLIAQARRILNGQEAQKIVIGRLATGDGGFNDGWSWH